MLLIFYNRIVLFADKRYRVKVIATQGTMP